MVMQTTYSFPRSRVEDSGIIPRFQCDMTLLQVGLLKLQSIPYPYCVHQASSSLADIPLPSTLYVIYLWLQMIQQSTTQHLDILIPQQTCLVEIVVLKSSNKSSSRFFYFSLPENHFNIFQIFFVAKFYYVRKQYTHFRDTKSHFKSLEAKIWIY